MIRIYLAGPMRGISEFNFPAFSEATKYLRDLGHEVFNPAERDADNGFDATGYTGTEDLSTIGFDLREALGADVAYISAEADMLVLLPGWEASMGVKAETALAEALRLPILTLHTFRRHEPEEVWEAKEIAAAEPYTGISSFAMASGTSEAYIPDSKRGLDVWAAAMASSLSPTTTEVRSVSRTGGEKGVKLARFDLIPPDALRQVAEHYGRGAEKYADNQYRRGYEWSKSFAALQRHAMDWLGGQDHDPETGSHEMACVAWHALTLLTFAKEHPDFDDRYSHGSD